MKSTNGGRRTFLKVGAGVVGGLVVGGAVAYVAKGSTVTTTTAMATETSTLTLPPVTSTQTNTQTVTAPPVTSTATTTATVTSPPVTSTVTSTTTSTNTSALAADQALLTSYSGIADGLITVNTTEAAVITAAANLIIPADSNGPGAAAAGSIYFIDRQLWGDYGSNGKMYNKGPFIQPNTPGPLTVPTLAGGTVTYTAGTPALPWANGSEYQYSMTLRNFWRFGIDALETYSTTAYGGAFENLSAANQLAALTDLFNNKPTTASFNYIIPSDFANELFFMIWAGFTQDPMYGGNRGLVGYTLTASPGMNSGNFYGEGQTPIQRAVSPTA